MADQTTPPIAGTDMAGYAIVMPPGWEQIPLRQGTDAAVKKILDNAFGRLGPDLPRDRVTPYRKELERRLGRVISQARNNGGFCLYLPVEHMHQAPIAASFVVSQGSLGSDQQIAPAAIMSELISGLEGAEQVTVDGVPAARIERVAPPEPETEIEQGSRRVDYVIPVPGQHDEWLVVAFSTLGGGDPEDEYAILQAELFDAIMATFRWTPAAQSAPENGPEASRARASRA
jgi:hypothetical protein